MRETAATAARETIAELCEEPTSADELLAEVAERVRRVVPFDNGAWMTTDPVTRLPTLTHAFDTDPEVGAAYCRSELEHMDDVISFDKMLSRGTYAASLAEATGGDLELSHRYREIHAPHSFRDELRMVAGSGGSTWAYACMTRGDDAPDFTPEEVRFVSSIAALLGQGIRTALVRAPVAEDLTAPGMLVLGPEFTVEAATGEAERWLSGMPDATGDELPKSLLTTAMVAQAIAAGADPGRKPLIRMHVPDRGWLLVHAAALNDAGGGPPRTAIMLEQADRATLLPLLLALHGLSEREREITQLLVGGRSTEEIAGTLHISRHTVRDHVKAIFTKVGVSSRPELTAKLAA